MIRHFCAFGANAVFNKYVYTKKNGALLFFTFPKYAISILGKQLCSKNDDQLRESSPGCQKVALLFCRIKYPGNGGET